jgi:hypothetical protein
VSELGGTTCMPSYHCSDNVSIEWYKGNQAFKFYYVSELGGTTHMSSYHCSDNVSIEWNKGNQAFKLYM